MWWYLLLLIPLTVVVWLLYEWMEHTMVQCNSTTVECQKLPPNKELRLCLVSDLHNNKKNIPAILKKIQEFDPEYVLLAGDMVNKHKSKNAYTEQFMEALNSLSVPVFYSQGNHELSLEEDFRQEWNRYINTLPEHVRYLDNESFLTGEQKELCITGLSLPRAFYKKGSLYKNVEALPEISVPENKFHILLAHHPEYAEQYKKYRADFIVSGHLHGGLVRLPHIGGLVSPRLRLPKGRDAGLIKFSDGLRMFVSRGLGSHTIPLRFFNRVEINFLVLKGTKE